ncbi:hypothetical protein C2845_PM18G05670 [Panicum miliaceum]|uniref:Uncharacterized protein n=1 Tax=Panicum miliaceum TaxID=4540 RepID=A0A3L6PJB2_PANMI|nr:hypothetical protein C2845_PM18G05670 [Panicum miliaceum]
MGRSRRDHISRRRARDSKGRFSLSLALRASSTQGPSSSRGPSRHTSIPTPPCAMDLDDEVIPVGLPVPPGFEGIAPSPSGTLEQEREPQHRANVRILEILRSVSTT